MSEVKIEIMRDCEMQYVDMAGVNKGFAVMAAGTSRLLPADCIRVTGLPDLRTKRSSY